MAEDTQALGKLSREDLDALAADAGVESPASYPNKAALMEALAAAGEQTTYGPYELVGENEDGEPVNSLTFGADPVHTIEAGDQFWTSELGEAQFLDEHPLVRGGS